MKSIREAFGKWLKETVFAAVVTTLPEPPPLDKGDLRWLNERDSCPDCQGKLFNPGPTGGMSFNIRCVGCGAKWCFCGPFTPLRIDNPDSVYDTSYGTLREVTGWQGYIPHVNGF